MAGFFCLFVFFLSIFLSDINIAMRACVDSGSVPSFAWRELRVSFHLSGERNHKFSGNFEARMLTFLPSECTHEENSSFVGYHLGTLCYFIVLSLKWLNFQLAQYPHYLTGWRNRGYFHTGCGSEGFSAAGLAAEQLRGRWVSGLRKPSDEVSLFHMSSGNTVSNLLGLQQKI